MINSDQPWSLPVRLDEIPDTGRRIELRAGDAVCEAIARAANAAGIRRLDAAFDLSRHGRDGLRVAGTVSAVVRQTCVVTLEPLENEIEEAIDLTFAPAREEISTAERTEEVSPVAGAADPPEALVDGTVDLGALAAEFLILAINPYPRKAGAVFEPPPSTDPGAKPFAALAGLRSRRAKS